MSDNTSSENNFKTPQSTINLTHKKLKTEDGGQQSATDEQSAKGSPEIPLLYKEPEWASKPPSGYAFEVLKQGVIISKTIIEKSLMVAGRLVSCDMVFEHPSVSRYHAIIQYCGGGTSHKKGFYIYDLGSTHGTFLNKEQITPKIYYQVKSGHVLKFGGSTRLYILQGPEEEDEVEDEEKNKFKTDVEDNVCNWGITEDAEEISTENPFALVAEKEEIVDPKKTLRNWFEREGYELKYNVEEKSYATFSCEVKLPIDNSCGGYLPVQVEVKGKKKLAVEECALAAVHVLEEYGLLHESHQSSLKKKKKNWEEADYYDSDEDVYFDRTGTIEKKRQKRMKLVGKTETESLQSLEKKYEDVIANISEIENKLSSAKMKRMQNIRNATNDDTDSLDSYMREISGVESIDEVNRSKLRVELAELKSRKHNLEQMINIITKPMKASHSFVKNIKTKTKLPIQKHNEKSERKVQKIDTNEVEEEEDEDSSDNESKNDPKTNPDIPNPKVDNLNIANKLETQDDNVIKKKCFPMLKDEIAEGTSKFPHRSESKNIEEAVWMPDSKNKKTKAKDCGKKSDVSAYANSSADQYSMWIPPTNQSGDGTSHLNTKYGY